MTQTQCDDRLSFMPLYMTDSVRNNIWLPPALRTGKQLQRISSFGMSILYGTVDNTTLSKLIFTKKNITLLIIVIWYSLTSNKYSMVVWPSGLRRLIQVETLLTGLTNSGALRYRKMQEFESLSNHLIFFNF